jgi:hypothetical protein
MSARDLLRLAAAAGWRVSKTSGGHLRLDHEDAAMPVYCASTPSDYRAMQNTLATMRRVLPKEPAALKPERPKRKPKPRQRQIRDAIDWQRPPEPEPPHGCGGSAPRRSPVPGAPQLRLSRWP